MKEMNLHKASEWKWDELWYLGGNNWTPQSLYHNFFLCCLNRIIWIGLLAFKTILDWIINWLNLRGTFFITSSVNPLHIVYEMYCDFCVWISKTIKSVRLCVGFKHTFCGFTLYQSHYTWQREKVYKTTKKKTNHTRSKARIDSSPTKKNWAFVYTFCQQSSLRHLNYIRNGDNIKLCALCVCILFFSQ